MDDNKDKSAETGSDQELHASTGDGATMEHPARRKKKGWMVFGIIVAVIAIVAIAFTVWHNTPGFCNAICHEPMDTYVETYYEGDPGMLVTQHATDEAGNMECLDCHEARLGEQISEVGSYMDDSFNVDENGYLQNGNASTMASPENCLKSGCHDWNEVVDSTWGFEGNDAEYNPHSSHQDGSVTCSDCHKSHQKSVLYCAECHDLNLPEGWEEPSNE
jgi:hypothetical protein